MRIAVLSDLHFGRSRPELIDPLLEAIDGASVDLVALAGDFVQRARGSQFAKAAAFLGRLDAPWIAVPGNHDIPLFNILARALFPRASYRRWIAEETEPLVTTPRCVIAGIDTTYRWHGQSGQVTQKQIERVASAIETSGDRIAIILAHHPFHQAEHIEKKLMQGAPRALEAWADAGPHVILSGHLHQWTVEPFVARKNQAMTLQVHCGTGLSTRLRGEPNEFAILDLSPPAILVERFAAIEAETGFQKIATYRYVVGPDGWMRGQGCVTSD